jgi:hypothetical protein
MVALLDGTFNDRKTIKGNSNLKEPQMASRKPLLFLLALATIALWIIVLQNARIIPPLKKEVVFIGNVVEVEGEVDVNNKVDIDGTVTIDNTVDVNLKEVVGNEMVCSERGMYVGVSSTENTVIPIHWGEISIAR